MEDEDFINVAAIVAHTPCLTHLLLKSGTLDEQIASAITASRHPVVAFECHYYHPTTMSLLLTTVHETLVWLRITASTLHDVYRGRQTFSLSEGGFPKLREFYVPHSDSETGLLLAMAEKGLPALCALELMVDRFKNRHTTDLQYISQVLGSYGLRIKQLNFQTLNARSHNTDEQQWTKAVLNQLPNLKDLAIGNIGSSINFSPSLTVLYTQKYRHSG